MKNIKSFILSFLAVVIFAGIAQADLNIGVGGAYRSDLNKWEYSGLLEILIPVVPGLKLGGGGQYFGAPTKLQVDKRDFILKNASYIPVYGMVRTNIPFAPVLSSFFVTGRLGRFFVVNNGDQMPQGDFWSLAVGKTLLPFLYVEVTYNVYQFDEKSVRQDKYAVTMGLKL
jgi:hypothetical protein